MSRRLCDRGVVQRVLIWVPSVGNSPAYGPGTYLDERRSLSSGSFFERERCLLPCDDCFLGMCFFWKPSYCLIQLSRYDQVLTGVLPYRGRSVTGMITDIRAGKRPSRPVHSVQSRWLRDPVWHVITAAWHDQPNQRCELSVMYHAFPPLSQQEVQHVESGDLNPQNDGNRTTTEMSKTPKRQLGKILPRIASVFQFLQNPESEVQRQVNEMNEVRFPTSPPKKRLIPPTAS